MPNKLITADLPVVIAARSVPALTYWNRLEGRPRAEKFDRALRAEVRDALWMATRQWQMGELEGDDAGSPVLAKIRIETTRLRTYRALDGPIEPFTDAMPLEPRVEQMPVEFLQRDHEMSLDIRLLMGRQWLKLARTLPAAAHDQFIAAYPVHVPDPTNQADAPTTAHQEAWADFAAAGSGRRMDGAKLYVYLKSDASHHASDGIAALAGFETQADALGDRFVRWFDALFFQPQARAAWEAGRLEYQFSCGEGGEQGRVLVGEQYFHGRIDWHNLDVDRPRRTPPEESPRREPPESTTLTMLPTQATFEGMPNSRWWAFEDGRTNFGDIKPDTTDLAKLLLIEFGLVYANDWFLVPFTVPAGAIATVRGMAVTNVFGERTWIEGAGRGADDDWQRWAMFLLSVRGLGQEPAEPGLAILPVAAQILDGRPLEDVTITRDEMANMVWAIEKTIPLPSGDPKDGREAAYETRRWYELDLERRLGHPPEPPPPAEGAKIRYEVMSSVPEHWIPMLPVHRPNDNREIQLQRGAMPRLLAIGETPQPVRPRTSLMRQGLDQGLPYFVYEEEVPRAGIRVMNGFRRTRWRDGRVWLWLGVRKQTGRGEGSSGLAFDRIVDAPPRAPGQP